jgi:hypothetical protein
MSMTAGEVLAKAADLIEARGWIQQEFETPHGVCALGAMQRITYGFEIRMECEDRARLALETEIGEAITIWNDAPGRTKEEVVTALRNAKRHLAPEDV